MIGSLLKKTQTQSYRGAPRPGSPAPVALPPARSSGGTAAAPVVPVPRLLWPAPLPLSWLMPGWPAAPVLFGLPD
ncbi:hypothetical protein ABZT49_28770, partial [Methylobacterium sp. EM32]|uniref:hypothetical protein n=1 Tax=Methylobacterium sp. EM32 TaxID=3163481 RepID=UPI0033AB0D4C